MIDKTEYENIEIPDDLDGVVDAAIAEGRRTRKKNRGVIVWRRVSVAVAVFVACFISLLNVSPVFAQAAYEVPVIGDLCRIVTFREYHFEDSIKYIDARIPRIENTGKTDLEKRVNLEIQKKIDDCIAENEEVAREYYEAFIETGGNPEEFTPMGITVDYEIKCMNDRFVSFVISEYETLFNAYDYEYYYNIDMESGRIITLKDWYGSNYRQEVARRIENAVSEWSDERRSILWDDISFADLISENTNFYISRDGDIVVVFPKYEVAYGAAGAVEITIQAGGADGGF